MASVVSQLRSSVSRMQHIDPQAGTRLCLLNLLTAPLEDNEADNICEAGFGLFERMAAKSLCEDALQLGNTGKRKRMITVQCTVGIHYTHQYYIKMISLSWN